MRKQAIFLAIAAPGWFLLISYLYYDYQEYGVYFSDHIFSFTPAYSFIFHALIFTAPIASMVFGYVISDRLRLLAEIREMESLYRDYYDNAPYGYHSADEKLNILDVNSTWTEMLGYERDEVVGSRKVTDFLTEKSSRKLQKSFEEFRTSGKIEDMELDFVRKDGSELPVLLSASAYYEGGRYVRSRTIIKDNTDRKTFERILHGVAEHWEDTFNAMPWGVMITDSNFEVLRYNEYFDSNNELSPREVATTYCARMVDGSKTGGNGNGEQMLSMEFEDEEGDRYYRMTGRPMSSGGVMDNYVFNLVDITNLKKGQHKLEDSRNAFFNMLKDASAAYKELDSTYRSMLLSFVNAIDAKSPWTKGHSERVRRYAVALGEAVGLNRKSLDRLETAALLHDIGKIGTYDYLLDKPGGLTEKEFDLVKLHPVHSANILEPISRLGSVVDIVKYHHEHYCGVGYPDGLKGEEIPLMARILCIADSYDSMIADRPYRVAQSRDYAIRELTECSGTHFDPMLAEKFIELIKEGKV